MLQRKTYYNGRRIWEGRRIGTTIFFLRKRGGRSVVEEDVLHRKTDGDGSRIWITTFCLVSKFQITNS